MGRLKAQARRLREILRLLDRLPEYDAEANRLYRELRRNAREVHTPHLESQPRPASREGRGRRKVATAEVWL